MVREHRTGSDPEIESIIASTALTYDLMPYTSNPFPQTQPGWLAAIARVFGLETTPIDKARILELGCASGGNIIPLAVRHPGAHILGVDLSRTQVAAGRARIAALELNNIEIQCQSFTELGAEDGLFDYIICHGVYSWVPSAVRNAILRICRERLSPTGIAIISYNVLPGWRQWQAVRDCLLLHVPPGHDVVARVAQARLFMNFLDENVPQSSPYHSVYKSWKQKFAQLPDDYIAHEFLEGVNEPSTFRDFLAAGEKHGLAYLAEVELASMILDNHPAKLAKSVQTLASNQLVATEQYLDMLTARTFRQSLLVSAERQAGINRNLKPERFADLHFIGGADLNFATDVKGGGVLSDASGRSATVTTQALGDALAQLVARFPASSSVETLFRALSASNRTDAVRQSLLDALYKMSISGLIRVSTEPVGAASLVRDRPIAWPLARKDAANGHLATVNLRHERVDIDILGQHILPLLDGTRNMQAVAAEVISAARQGRLNFARDGIPIKDETALRQAVDAQVAAVLASFARAALLTG